MKKLAEVFTIISVATVFVIVTEATEAADDGDGIHSTSRGKSLQKRPFYGDKLHPAKSCKDIFKRMPNLPSGVYWLDVFDWGTNKIVQERHFCQNTFPNETQTGMKYKGQQGEIGVEDLSHGKPDPEPFDWEELTNENWPLPITPPTEEEMRQRLQKQIQVYKLKMKKKDPEKPSSHLTTDSRNNDSQSQKILNPVSQEPVVEANSTTASVQNGNLSVSRNNVSARVLPGDSLVEYPTSQNGTSYHEANVYSNAVQVFKDLNLTESERNQSISSGNLLHYVPVGSNVTNHSTYQYSSGLQSENESRSFNYYDYNAFHNPQNPSYVNISSDIAPASAAVQDGSNQNYTSLVGSHSNNQSISNPFDSHRNESDTVNAAVYGNLSSTDSQESKQWSFNSTSGYIFDSNASLENQSFPSSRSLNTSSRQLLNGSSQYWNGEYQNEKPSATLTLENSSLYGNRTQEISSGYNLNKSRVRIDNVTVPFDQLDLNHYMTAPNRGTESNVTLPSVPVIFKSDWNPKYDSNRSFALSSGNRSFGQYWSDTVPHSNESSVALNNSGFVYWNSSDVPSEPTGPLNTTSNQDIYSGYESAWNRGNSASNSSYFRADFLKDNHGSITDSRSLSSNYTRPDLSFHTDTEGKSSVNISNDTYILPTHFPRVDAGFIPTNESSAKLSNLKLDYSLSANYINGSKSLDLIANTTSADNIRSDQYWNPGYDWSSSSNGSSAESDNIRSDLYWNPGYASNESIHVLGSNSSESAENANSSVQELGRFQNGSIFTATVDIAKENSNSSGVDVVNSSNSNDSSNYQIVHYNFASSSLTGSLFDRVSNQSDYTDEVIDKTLNISHQYGHQDLQSKVKGIYGNIAEDSSERPSGYLVSVNNGSSGGANDSVQYSHDDAAQLSERVADANIGLANDTDKSIGSSNIRQEIAGRKQTKAPDRYGNQSHGRVRMILKGWSKLANNGRKGEEAIDNRKSPTKVIKLENGLSLVGKTGAAKDVTNKDLERERLFVKPGLNIGVIETTKDLSNDTKRKDTVARFKLTHNDLNNALKVGSQASEESKRTVVVHDQTATENLPEDSPVFTGQAMETSPRLAGEPVKIPNPDELNRGLWTEEAIHYSKKANEDFAKQMKYMNKHGGTMDALISDYNKANEGQDAVHDPKNAGETKAKMADFFARNQEIVSKNGGLAGESSGNTSPSATLRNPEKGTNVAGLGKGKNYQVSQPGTSSQLSLSSSAGSEAGAESQTESWAEVGTNAGSSTGTESDTQLDEEDFDDDWDADEEQQHFEEYDRPQGLGLWTDSETGTGVNVGVGIGASADADSGSDVGVDESSKTAWPGFGFSNGFGMGMNTGSQSGSETMTETSVGVNSGTSTETSTETDSTTDSKSEPNQGSKSKSRYKWRKGPIRNTGNAGYAGVNALNQKIATSTGDANAEAYQGNGYPGKITNGIVLVPVQQNIKEKAEFRPNPQLGIQTNSNANTKVQASASAQTQSGKMGGSKTKPKASKPKSVSQINMEKAKERLKKQMKKHQEELEASTRNNPLHKWKLFGKTPLQARLEAILESTRNIPVGPNLGDKSNKNNSKDNGKGKIDPNKVEASVDIKYEGENTKGVTIDAGVSTKLGGDENKPKNGSVAGRKGAKAHKNKKDWRTFYKWYEKYPFSIPSIAEINKKLNSMPYALYKVRMRKLKK